MNADGTTCVPPEPKTPPSDKDCSPLHAPSESHRKVTIKEFVVTNNDCEEQHSMFEEPVCCEISQEIAGSHEIKDFAFLQEEVAPCEVEEEEICPIKERYAYS